MAKSPGGFTLSLRNASFRWVTRRNDKSKSNASSLPRQPPTALFGKMAKLLIQRAAAGFGEPRQRKGTKGGGRRMTRLCGRGRLRCACIQTSWNNLLHDCERNEPPQMAYLWCPGRTIARTHQRKKPMGKQRRDGLLPTLLQAYSWKETPARDSR
eukprot:scaffold1981_cov345-Pinguiococcus_pyrenoidosus.AAC.16